MRYVVEVIERHIVELNADTEQDAIDFAPMWVGDGTYYDSEAKILETIEDAQD